MGAKPRLTFEHEGEDIRHCQACNAKIFFKQMPSGKMMPVSLETGESHFADCPNAGDFRNRKHRNVIWKKKK